MSVDSNQLFAAYATGISVLSQIQVFGGGQRLVLAPMSDYAIPSNNLINPNYENWNIYQFANNVPRLDDPILSDTGIDYTTAYNTYLANIDLSTQAGVANPDAVDAAWANLLATERQLSVAKKTALVDFASDCPGGIDFLTGDPTTFRDWYPVYHPEIRTLINAVAAADEKWAELLAEESGTFFFNQLNQFRDNLHNGLDAVNPRPGYNMPANNAPVPLVSDIINGQYPAVYPAVFYTPAFSIGGDFDKVVADWVNTFPAEYPEDRTRYDRGRTVTKVSTQDSAIHTGNPVRTFPTLIPNATTQPNIKGDVLQEWSTVIMGYGVEVSFTLNDSAFRRVQDAVKTATSRNGGFSIFGSIYNGGSSSSSSNTNDWDDLKLDSTNNTVVLVAKHNKVPMLLAAIANTLDG